MNYTNTKQANVSKVLGRKLLLFERQLEKECELGLT